jgi:hypothetical protein
MAKKGKIVLMHQLNSVSNSGLRSNVTSAKTSNRLSKNSINDDKASSNNDSSMVFEKAP